MHKCMHDAQNGPKAYFCTFFDQRVIRQVPLSKCENMSIDNFDLFFLYTPTVHV